MVQENYLVNGVKLDDPVVGWRLLDATLPRVAHTMRSTTTTQPGRDGATHAPSTRGGTVPQFEVVVPASDWETLLALVSAPSLVVTRADVPGRALYGKLKSVSSPKDYPRSGMVSAVVYIDVPDGCWRGTESTSELVASVAGGVTGSVFAGLSAPVQDAIVRLRGPLTNPQLLDASGAFVAVEGTLAADQFLRFDSNSGRAWTTTTDTWNGGTEVSGLVDFGGPRGVFEITPQFDSPTVPGVRSGRLTLSYDSYGAGSGFQVRGRPAYLT